MEFQTPESEAVQTEDFQTPDHEAVGEDEGALMAAGRGALRNFPLAQQVTAGLQSGPYAENLKGLVSSAEASKAAHPWAYGAGAFVGTAAPALIPGVAEAPVIGSAITNALQSQADTNLTNASMADVQDAAKAGLIGGALGKAGAMLSPAKAALPLEGKLASAVESGAQSAVQPAIKAVAEKAAPKAARQPLAEVAGMAVPNKKVAADFVPSAKRVYASNLAQGLGGTPRQFMKVFGKENPVEALNKIGNWMETAGPGGKSLHGLLDQPGELLEKVDNLHDSAGKTIGEIIDTVGGESATSTALRVPHVDRAGLLRDLQEAALNTADPQTEARIAKLLATAQRLETKRVTDFEMLQQLKGMAGKQIAKDPEMSQVYGMLAERASAVVDQYGQFVNNPALKALYTKAKLDYHNSSQLLPMLRYAEARELVGGPAGHHTLRGLLSTIINLSAETVGAPGPGQLARNVAIQSAPMARNVVNAGAGARAAAGATATNVSNRLPLAAQLELANALEQKHGKKK